MSIRWKNVVALIFLIIALWIVTTSWSAIQAFLHSIPKLWNHRTAEDFRQGLLAFAFLTIALLGAWRLLTQR